MVRVVPSLRNGPPAEEIREVLLHSAVYSGAPAANSAFAIAKRVLEESAQSHQ